jgi:hypothetical protein
LVSWQGIASIADVVFADGRLELTKPAAIDTHSQ